MASADTNAALSIGVLALQGAFQEHCEALRAVGVGNVVEVRLPEQLDGLDGLVIPGGESTAIIRIAKRWSLVEPLRKWVRDDKPVWGTCAGLILLANDARGTEQGGQELLGGLDVTVQRNYFGSQVGSFSEKLQMPSELGENVEPYNAVFIRAPGVLRCGPGVTSLCSVQHKSTSKDSVGHGEDVVVAVRQGKILGTSFHPELTNDTRWHRFFVEHVVRSGETLVEKVEAQASSPPSPPAPQTAAVASDVAVKEGAESQPDTEQRNCMIN